MQDSLRYLCHDTGGEPVGPVPGVERVHSGEQRPAGTLGHRHFARPGRVQYVLGVADHLVDADVAGHAGHRPQLQIGVTNGEQQRQRVIDAGVDIEDDRSRRHDRGSFQTGLPGRLVD